MDKVIIGFSRPRKWKPFAWLIQTALRIPYDHVYINVLCREYDRNVIYQASGTAVNFLGEIKFDEENIIVAEFEMDIDPDNKKEMVQFAIDSAGKPYGVKEIAGLAMVIVAGWFGKRIKNPLRDGTSSFVCSELVSYLLQQYAGVDLPKDYEDMTPKDVYDYMISLGDKVKQK